jgi:hypothetical protein
LAICSCAFQNKSGGTIASWTFSMTIQRSLGLRVVFATFFGMADPSEATSWIFPNVRRFHASAPR